MIKGMNHVGMSVANLERSIQFYRDLLGMDVIVRAPFAGENYERILGLEGAQGSVALLKMKDADMGLELFEFSRPAPKAAHPSRPVCDHGITHLCFQVADIDAAYERLKTSGVSFHCPPLKFARTGNKATYGRDPDGNVFELLEKAAPANSPVVPDAVG